jgi:cytochrome c biogenesis protein CcmG/thiol:disulfide interchange protein DsbE
MKRIFGVLATFALVGALVFAMLKGFGKNPREVPFKLQGQPAPAFSMPTLQGETLGLEAFHGRYLVINFWSSWCGPCAEEAGVLEAAFRKWGKNVAFLGVVFEDSEANARRFLQRFPASYPQLFSPVSTMAIDYAVTGVPETYFIDKEGNIAGKYAAPILELRQFDFLLSHFLLAPEGASP